MKHPNEMSKAHDERVYTDHWEKEMRYRRELRLALVSPGHYIPWLELVIGVWFRRIGRGRGEDQRGDGEMVMLQ